MRVNPKAYPTLISRDSSEQITQQQVKEATEQLYQYDNSYGETIKPVNQDIKVTDRVGIGNNIHR